MCVHRYRKKINEIKKDTEAEKRRALHLCLVFILYLRYKSKGTTGVAWVYLKPVVQSWKNVRHTVYYVCIFSRLMFLQENFCHGKILHLLPFNDPTIYGGLSVIVITA